MILIFRRNICVQEVQAVGWDALGAQCLSQGLRLAPSSFLECDRFSAFPTMNGPEIREAGNVGILRKLMIQLGTQGT